MIEIKQLGKKFEVENPKKLSEQEKKDPRLKGRFFHSVTNVSFSVDDGQVLGLLGPNGAGKTTTLRVLSTALQADSGEVVINGINVLKNPLQARKKIGFLSGSTGLYGRLTGRENIRYFGQLHGMSKIQIDLRIAALSEMLEMDTFLDRRCENFSTGMKQKTAIARAVVHQPEVVILDEPTTGLDIMATQTVMNFIQDLKTQRVPVIFSTHHLDEVSKLCDRVAVIDKGISKFDDSIDVFNQLANGDPNAAFLDIINGGQ
ncbi:ATP-binding cassette domain-containing protein [Aliiglaciecola litoralis]|uniref:ATP-binding cassette domain-containing protein n=1 Tax=Aliiglaciecola litoralis TaxID=582857 RepID=A0ABN1LP06_9ALTE